jgi:hypothetical protein
MLTQTLGSGDGSRALVEALKVARSSETYDVYLHQSRPFALRREELGKWLRSSQIVCLENSHFSCLYSSGGRSGRGMRNGAGRLGIQLSASSLSPDRR